MDEVADSDPAALAARAVERRVGRRSLAAPCLACAARAAGPDGRPAPDECRAQCELIRDVFGDPLRPAAPVPAWLSPVAAALAGRMYDHLGFSGMPLLADAFRGAGCGDADVLGHCRDRKQPHVRGCWVVDLVLGRA